MGTKQDFDNCMAVDGIFRDGVCFTGRKIWKTNCYQTGFREIVCEKDIGDSKFSESLDGVLESSVDDRYTVAVQKVEEKTGRKYNEKRDGSSRFEYESQISDNFFEKLMDYFENEITQLADPEHFEFTTPIGWSGTLYYEPWAHLTLDEYGIISELSAGMLYDREHNTLTIKVDDKSEVGKKLFDELEKENWQFDSNVADNLMTILTINAREAGKRALDEQNVESAWNSATR